jgi:hypothetical protein
MSLSPVSDVHASTALTAEQAKVHVVKGHAKVRPLANFLHAFAEHCGQPGTMQDLGFFLSPMPGAIARIPYLLVVSRSHRFETLHPRLDDVLGVLLIFEYGAMGKGTRAFATKDRSGRNTLLALPGCGQSVVAFAIQSLLEHGAQVVLVSYRSQQQEAGGALPPLGVRAGKRSVARWATRERTIQGYLPLEPTFDATLANIGQRTRSNLRYYRRRAEKQLGCTFLPEAQISREELVEYNQQCKYAVPAAVAAWRFDSLKYLSTPLLMGLKNREGEWLSLLGGRRYAACSEIFWQMNRNGYETDSLSTVMRSYFIEHEIAQGSTRMYIEGGTPQPIRFSFVEEKLIDLAVVRQSPVGKMMAGLAGRYISPLNQLAKVLGEPELGWADC